MSTLTKLEQELALAKTRFLTAERELGIAQDKLDRHDDYQVGSIAVVQGYGTEVAVVKIGSVHDLAKRKREDDPGPGPFWTSIHSDFSGTHFKSLKEVREWFEGCEVVIIHEPIAPF